MYIAHRLAYASVVLLTATLASATRAAPVPAPTAQGELNAGTANRITGIVWLDEDRDGLQGLAETGVEGVVAKLLDAYGRDTGKSATTNQAGFYAFAGLDDGEYRVAFERPAGQRFTRSDVGSEDPQGQRIGHDERPDDSDLNLINGHFDPAQRGPYETGMRYYELTRLDGLLRPWPINGWVVYPATAGSQSAPAALVRELYLGDAADMSNNVATSKFATSISGGDPDDVTAADPDRRAQDIEARIDAPVSPGGPFPVVIVFSGLFGSAADMVEVGDQLASHGYVVLCTESSAFHASLALGGRLAANGGIYQQSDFDHVQQIDGAQLDMLIGYGYQVSGYLTGDWPGSGAYYSDVLLADASFSLDRAGEWNAQSGHALEGKLDLKHVGWYGYSAGARYAALAVTSDPRIAFLINVDSGAFVNVPKPMMWVGNHSTAPTLGPSVQARLTGDFHPHYFLIPAIEFDPPAASNLFHREYHHDFRNTLITAFCGHYLKNALAYRGNLGFDGQAPLFDGYVTPYLTANIPGWHSEPVAVANGAAQEIDAGLVDVRLWVLESNQLSSFTTEFLPAGRAASATKTDHGSVVSMRGTGLVPLHERTRGLALDDERRGWFLAGTPPSLYELDLAAIAGGAPVIAQPLGVVAGLPNGVRSLSYEPRGSRLLALSGTPARLFAFSAEAAPVATDLGPLPGNIASPSGVDLDARRRAWASDASGEELTRISPGTGQELGALGLAGLHATCIAYDDVSKLLLMIDGQSGKLHSVNPENGDVSSHGSIGGLDASVATAIAFERGTSSAHVPSLDADVAPIGGGPQPLLENISLEEPASGWDGYLLRVQIGEGTGLRSDPLSLEAAGAIALGARLETDLPRLSIGEAQEVLWNGGRVAWLETDWDLAIGGTRLAPVRIAFTAAASAPAVAAVIEALRYGGPLPRRFELELTDAEGQRNLAEVVELR